MRLWRTAALLLTFSVVASTSQATAGDEKRTIEAIENDLVADDPAVRAKGAAELTDRFPDGAVAVPMLVDLLDDESPEVVAAATKAIDSMTVAGAAPLAEYLANDERWKPDGWIHAICGTVASGKAGEPGWSLFEPRLRGDTAPPTCDELAVTALFPSVRDAPRVLDAMRRTTGVPRALAATSLTMLGAVELGRRPMDTPPRTEGRSQAAAKALPLLASRNHLEVWAGTKLIERLRCTDEDVVAALLAIVTDPNGAGAKVRYGDPIVSARRGAFRALGAIGPEAARCVPALLSELTAENAILTLEEAADALVRLGKESDVVAVLGRRPLDRDIAFCVLANRRSAVASLVPLLIAEVESRRFPSFTLYALADLGPVAIDALPALKKRMFSAPDAEGRLKYDERLRYADAVLAIAPQDADAIALIASAPKEFGDAALRVLARRAATIPDVVDRAMAFFRRQCANDVVDYGMIESLARFGGSAAPATGDLLEILTRSPSSYVETLRVVARTLGHIGPDAAAAVPALTALRDKGDETIRVPAAQALRRIKVKK